MVSLQLTDLGAAYRGHKVFAEISTPALQGGQLVALLGPNGAGKSTLFRRIFGLLSGPGQIRIEGATAARPIAYMPQDNGARPVLSVYESILLARMQGRRLKVLPEDHAEVERVLNLLSITHLRGHNVGDLSGGQRQMVNAAQALAQQPQILLMDEPTSALDLSRQIDLMSLLHRLTREQGLLIIVAMHDLGHALRFADAAMVVNRGRMVACGPTHGVVTANLLREVFEVEARVEPCSKGTPQLVVEGRAAQPA
ncbi:ABC transporter ATP-binding protein [Paracoccus aestuariivivens]|uniref:ATP-binding cassette domain-containing protein n=1 Tax=Paracoccus aestuariivivens TaxID=1820333 RepID=A0A6L6J8V6_9RHOB|nr:ABC transporter ATP-binding protein [Paracoccus aestuariivivens]MTH76564.1 ATP-binding cassette domain-containing protein [Paracoccus aestuariivivens]